MSERKSKRPPTPNTAAMNQETLRETLGELALNIDDLVDNLTMGMPDPEPTGIEAATEQAAEPETAPVSLARMAAAAPTPTFESAQPGGTGNTQEEPASMETGSAEHAPGDVSIEQDAELVDLAEGLIGSVEADPRDASGSPAIEPAPDADWAEPHAKTDDRAGDDERIAIDSAPQDGYLERETDVAAEYAAGSEAEATSEMEAAPEEDATTAGVIPWTAQEEATRASRGGAIWKIAAILVTAGLLGGGWYYWNGRGDGNARQAASPPPVNRTLPLTASTSARDSAADVSLASMASLTVGAANTPSESEPRSENTLEAVEDPGKIAPLSAVEPPRTTAAQSELPLNTPRVAVEDSEPAAPEEIVPVGNPPVNEVPATIAPRPAAKVKTVATDVVATRPNAGSEPETVRVAEAAAQTTPDESVEIAQNFVEPEAMNVNNESADAAPIELAQNFVEPADTAPIQPLPAAISTAAVTTPEPAPPAETAVAMVDPIETPAAQVDDGSAERIFQPPKLIRRGKPDYSERARKKGESGVVELMLLVDPTGSVKRVIIEHGMPGSELEASAISAALRSRYEPAMNDGEAVEAWASERFVFEP